MVSKEEEKNYKKPKISKIWNFLIYGSTIAIGVFLIWLYSAYIFINKWKKVKKSGNVKRRNVHHGKAASVIAIIEGYEYKGIQSQPPYRRFWREQNLIYD